MIDPNRLDQLEQRLAYVEKLISGMNPGERKIIRDAPFTGVISDVAFETGLTVRDMIGPDRVFRISRARHAVCWIMRQAHPDYSTKRIAELLGGRDHTTIVSSVKRGEVLREKDPGFRALTDKLLRAAQERKEA
jgi:chromosomal replication initiation ATPase DnaA